MKHKEITDISKHDLNDGFKVDIDFAASKISKLHFYDYTGVWKVSISYKKLKKAIKEAKKTNKQINNELNKNL